MSYGGGLGYLDRFLTNGKAFSIYQATRQVRRRDKNQLLSPLSFFQHPLVGKVQQIGPSRLVNDVMTRLMTGEGVAVSGMLEGVADGW